MMRRNGCAPPVGTVLSRTPGAAAVVTAVRYWFAAAWSRFGLAAVAAEYARGRERGEAAELVRGFACRMVAAGLAPGLPEARIWGHALGLADAAANAAAYAMQYGAATPLALVPELAPSVLGCAPSTRAHTALVRALGPYAVLARLSPGGEALQPPAEAHTVYPGPLGDPGQHPAPSQAHLVAALLAEVVDEHGRASTAPVRALASLCLGTQQAHPELVGQPQRAREYLAHDFVARMNSAAVRAESPAADLPLTASPGAAALMAKLRVCFFLAWGRGNGLEQAAAARGEAEGGALLAGFARRVLAAGYVPGLHVARTPEQADRLACAAAMRDAKAVIWGVATPLSLCPALPDEVVGGPPGSPAAAALARALGPFAALARPQLPCYWMDPDAQPATVTTYAAPSPNPNAVGLFAPKRLPPFTPDAAAAAAPAGRRPDPGSQLTQTGLLGSLAGGAADGGAHVDGGTTVWHGGAERGGPVHHGKRSRGQWRALLAQQHALRGCTAASLPRKQAGKQAALCMQLLIMHLLEGGVHNRVKMSYPANRRETSGADHMLLACIPWSSYMSCWSILVMHADCIATGRNLSVQSQAWLVNYATVPEVGTSVRKTRHPWSVACRAPALLSA